ncbi:MAG: hypothetical protein EBU08_16375 [Micrococcales bacterium]|nr:hypothetical protein [Micrococcales bacterium]
MSTYKDDPTQYARDYYHARAAADPEYKKKRAMQSKAWRDANQSKVKAGRKNSRTKDLAKARAGERVRHNRRSLISKRLDSARGRAKKEGLPFDLTAEYITSIWPAENKCPIFNTPFKTARLGESRDASPSLERIDPAKGYVQGNILVVSLKANRMKNNGSLEELKLLVEYYDALLRRKTLLE